MDLDAGLVAVGFGGIAYGVGVDRAVFKFDAVGNALHVVFRNVSVAPYVIYLFLYVFGVGELRSQIAVVCEQEYAGSVAVETSHRIDSFGACAFDEIHDSHAAVGIVAGGNAVFRFVEQDVALALHGNNLFIIFYYIVVADFCAEFRNYLSVYLYKSLRDKLVGLAARADAGVAHELVEADLFVGIGNRHLVFDALGAWNKTFAASGEAVVLLLIAAVVVIVVVTLAVVVVASVLTVVISSALTVIIVVVTSVLTVVVSALAVIVVVTLAVIVVSALTVVVITPVLTVVVTSALTVVIPAIVVVVLAGSIVVVCRGLGVFGIVLAERHFGRRVIVVLWPLLIVIPLLVSVVVAVIVVISTLTVVVALLTLLVVVSAR